MGSKDLKTRDQIDKKYKWNIEAMIADESTIDKDLEDVKAQASAYAEEFSGKLTQSSSILLKAYKDRDSIWRKLENIYVYSRMRRDENNAESKYQAMSDKCGAVNNKNALIKLSDKKEKGFFKWKSCHFSLRFVFTTGNVF